MCAVIPHHLGKGGPLRASRCIPPGSWRVSGIEPHHASEPYRRFISRRGAVALPGTPSTEGAVVLPGPMTRGYRAALDPLAGPRAFPLHRHRTLDKRSPFHRAWAASVLPKTPWPTIRRLDAAIVLPLDCAPFADYCARINRAADGS
jgi:hypothetical protein